MALWLKKNGIIIACVIGGCGARMTAALACMIRYYYRVIKYKLFSLIRANVFKREIKKG
jgi:hypothetical protein